MTKVLPLTALAAAGILALAPMAFAADEYNVSNGLTLAGNPLGMHGFDPVAQISSGSAVDGYAEHSAIHDGVEYYFSSAETKAAFEADPAALLPQYGGFCALGVSVGKKLDGDVRYADVVDGKLYLFVNAAVLSAYEKDKAGVLSKAEEVWSEIRETPIEQL